MKVYCRPTFSTNRTIQIFSDFLAPESKSDQNSHNILSEETILVTFDFTIWVST